MEGVRNFSMRRAAEQQRCVCSGAMAAGDKQEKEKRTRTLALQWQILTL